ncbi:uncharacterized protein SOCE26_007940 [Sorangium cellulosum]|uniref:Uncharacterized protein n=1 Tax=Sorangium cellulosum TaxID=56 RepID=A0A2L0EJC9_SORCE|nr:uncharacterized protein SOCE26_007940 [Sorangium cellulosum]
MRGRGVGPLAPGASPARAALRAAAPLPGLRPLAGDCAAR